MFVDSYGTILKELHDGTINHFGFLEKTNCLEQFKKWCEGHSVEPDEEKATLFFDMHGFEESEIVKEFVEPVY